METIQALKAKGFTHIQFELKDSGNPVQALVEVIPGNGEGSVLDNIPLAGREILDYFGESSPMARYVIDPQYLAT
ncbi:hypothetical protein SAMN05661099_1996 [Daejeonella lutea]|uniref:Uncharacterized protein n=2 Tax=Daejeonella lutea TaxID=572036 RepID=A0A1T5CXQ1_9SPHI|nr:hypothetical protein SAMN05661099_1996 [Daejeonella lutea]